MGRIPLNVYNLVLDLYNPFQQQEDQETMLIIYAVCHLLGMSSACANPWLYGWYNDNFRSEFRDIISPILRCFGYYCPTLARQISVSVSSSKHKGAQRGGTSSGLNGGAEGNGGLTAGGEEREIQTGDYSPSRLTNNIPMTSTQGNPLTCDIEVTLIDSSCVQTNFQSSPML